MIEFLERAKKFSKRTAIVSGQAEYNYDQLLRKSNSNFLKSTSTGDSGGATRAGLSLIIGYPFKVFI